MKVFFFFDGIDWLKVETAFVDVSFWSLIIKWNGVKKGLRVFFFFFFLENGIEYEPEKYKNEKYAFAVRLSLSAHLLSWGTRRIKTNKKIKQKARISVNFDR